VSEPPSLRLPILMFVTDRSRVRQREYTGSEKLDDIAREASLGGVNCVQLREKDLPTAALIELGLHVRDAIAERALLLVNGDAEAAHSLGAALHLPEGSLTVAEARAIVGNRALISCAVHSAEAAQQAADEGADLLVAGMVFKSRSKPGATALGIEGLRRITQAVGVPVVAIGGITEENAGDVLRAGASGVAVIGAIMDVPDPRAAARDLRLAIDSAWSTR
jgi:thiamine-phosphate pyrophosphorylase